MVEESLAGTASIAEVARRHDLHPNLLHLWRRQARSGVLTGTPAEGARFMPVAIVTGAETATVVAKGGGRDAIIEVVLRNGRVLRLPDGVAPARAMALADALEGTGR
jgi:transposase